MGTKVTEEQMAVVKEEEPSQIITGGEASKFDSKEFKRKL